MADINHFITGDIQQDNSGGLGVVDGEGMGRQRVLRRLLSNPALYDGAGNVIAAADYIYEPTYGAGLRRKIGATMNLAEIRALILSQMYLESAVLHNPEPTIALKRFGNGGLRADIQYTDANSKRLQTLSFTV